MTTITATMPIEARMPQPMSEGWNRLTGVTVTGRHLTIDPSAYFFRYENPSWLICDWQGVRKNLVERTETPEVALEQLVLDYVRRNGQPTNDPTEVLSVAWEVYSYLFRDELLADPGLAHVDQRYPAMLREMATVMALNRVDLDGGITNVGPAWFFADVAGIVFGLTEPQCAALDELYHGGWFNEARRVESVKAHAALGGRLVHGCQSAPDMSGGVVAPYGCDIGQFQTNLNAFKADWRHSIA